MRRPNLFRLLAAAFDPRRGWGAARAPFTSRTTSTTASHATRGRRSSTPRTISSSLATARTTRSNARTTRSAPSTSSNSVGSARPRGSTRRGRGRAEQVRQVFDKHRAYLDAEVDVAAMGIRTTGMQTELSRARLQLVRLRQLARIGRMTRRFAEAARGQGRESRKAASRRPPRRRRTSARTLKIS